MGPGFLNQVPTLYSDVNYQHRCFSSGPCKNSSAFTAFAVVLVVCTLRIIFPLRCEQSAPTKTDLPKTNPQTLKPQTLQALHQESAERHGSGPRGAEALPRGGSAERRRWAGRPICFLGLRFAAARLNETTSHFKNLRCAKVMHSCILFFKVAVRN